MIRLAVAELRADWRLWLGPLLVIITAAALSHLAVTYWWSVGTESASSTIRALGTTVEELRVGSYVLYLSTGLPAVIVLSSVSAAAVDAQRVKIARWRLSGALPGQVRRIVAVQILCVSLVGSLIGIAISVPFVQPAVDVLVQLGTRTNATIDASVAWPGVVGTVAATVVLCLIGAIRPAARAARVPAVEAIRVEAAPRGGMTVARWIIAGVLLLFALQQITITVITTVMFRGDAISANLGLSNAMTLGVVLVITMAVFAPLFLSLVLRGWGALIPARLSTSWFLARHSTSARLKTSTAAIVPLMVGVSVYGIMFGLIATWQASLAATGSIEQLNTLDTYVVLTPAAIITTVGSIATVFMTSRSREHEFAVLRSAGADMKTIYGMTIAEAALYTLTAVLLGLVSIAAATLTLAGTLAASGMPFTPVINITQALVLCLIAFIGMILAVAIPARLSSRQSIRTSLSPI